jgi:predicted alpha/beta-fold hydrolase
MTSDRKPSQGSKDPLDSWPAFRPLPLLSNPHLQTVLGHILPGPVLREPTREHVVWLPDGDGLVLHDNVPPGWPPGGRIVVLIHGLSGSAHSMQVQRMAVRLLKLGSRVVRLDMRGAGRGVRLARRAYHGGRTEDIRAVFAEVHHWSPTSSLGMLGVSLGGNLALKLAGEAGDVPVPGLDRVAALGPPIDMVRCARLLTRPGNRIYEKNFLRDLLFEAEQRHRHFTDLPPLRLPRRLTMRIFDDLYTAPCWEFNDAVDYYRRASSLPFIERITVPTLILTARDDPFIAVEPFERLKVPDNITLRILPRGGHLGFIGWDGAGGFRWAERCIVEWIAQP